MEYVVLLADNDPKFLGTWGKFLSDAGYHVRQATNPEEARRVLQDGGVDLAIIDLRLETDEQDDDLSGLELARDYKFRNIPKIILTAFKVKLADLTIALGMKADELPPAVAVADKTEGPEELLRIVRDTLESWPRLRMSTTKVSEQTKADYETATHQAKLNYRVALAVSIFGFLVIFAGICLAWSARLTIAIVGTATGLLTEALGYLFFRRLDLANDRMDLYHRELLETYWLELLIAACQQLPSEKRISCMEQAIHAATDRWLSSSSVTKAAPKKRVPSSQQG